MVHLLVSKLMKVDDAKRYPVIFQITLDLQCHRSDIGIRYLTCSATGQISDSVVFDYMRVNKFARVLFVL